MINTRKLVITALMETEKGGYSNLILKKNLNSNALSLADSKFVSALFYGVLERKITLDYIIENQSGRTINKISEIVLNALRIGLYQMLYMDKVPDSAAINESVKIVKNSKQKYLAGFTNAVLRNCQRNREKLMPKADSEENLSVLYSCPLWIIKSLIKDYGFQDTVKFLENSLNPSLVIIRVNNYKTDEETLTNDFLKQNIECEKTDIENYIIIKNSGNIAENVLYKKGLFHIQDLASAYCVNSLDAKKGDSVLDVCAAPGGKTFSIAENMQNEGLIYSCDIHNHRVELIKNGCERLGLSIIKAIANDATKFNEEFPKFDKILCDVPCSGLGIIGRKPDIKYKNEKDITELPSIQFEILSMTANYLKQHGRIVYSTCTLRKSENEDVVKRFLESNHSFKLVSQKNLFPHKDGTDGFFVAILER